ncbi:unnamed protein product [Miscanthus lutarioriparius]|uniref:Uncharacterized protein n=1 Tax=Miscanthus lutarioriparius TaxID=422564 RepID=A0A811PH04_9POAL|nr:unnamed protein product [Miscanthus lutarioriparius]
MARACATVVLALAVCCLLVATAPARRPVDLPASRAADAVVLVDRKAAAEPLPRPVGAAADCAEAAADEQGTALAVPEEEGDAARVEATSAGASALEVRPSSEETTTAEEDGWGWPAVSGKSEDDERRPYDSDSDSDCDSDSDDEDEGGIFRWLWRLADHLF